MTGRRIKLETSKKGKVATEIIMEADSQEARIHYGPQGSRRRQKVIPKKACRSGSPSAELKQRVDTLIDQGYRQVGHETFQAGPAWSSSLAWGLQPGQQPNTLRRILLESAQSLSRKGLLQVKKPNARDLHLYGIPKGSAWDGAAREHPFLAFGDGKGPGWINCESGQGAGTLWPEEGPGPALLLAVLASRVPEATLADRNGNRIEPRPCVSQEAFAPWIDTGDPVIRAALDQLGLGGAAADLQKAALAWFV